MRRRSALVVCSAVAALAVTCGGTVAGAATPEAKLMAITADDLGGGAVVESQGATTSGPIPARSGFQRSFTGARIGDARLFTLQDTAVVGKTPSAAAKLVSSILIAASSKSGRDALYRESQKSFAASSKLTVTKGAVTRAGELKAGDDAVEIVFRFETASGSFQVGEIFVRVGRNLSALYYGAGTAGVTQAGARRLALAAAKRMQEAGATG